MQSYKIYYLQHVRHLLANNETTVVGRQKYSANAHALRISYIGPLIALVNGP